MDGGFSTLLPAFLYEAPDEILAVLLEDVIDVVQHRVDVLVELVLAVGDVGRGLGLDLVDLLAGLARSLLAAGVLARHLASSSFAGGDPLGPDLSRRAGRKCRLRPSLTTR